MVCAGHGDLREEFHVYRGVLRHQTLAFDYTLNSDGSYELSLPSVDPDIFKAIQYWMYTGKFWDSKSCEDGENPLSFQDALDIYFFAVKHIMHDLQNHALSLVYCLIAHDDWSVSASQVDTIYKNTTLDSPLRRFLITICTDTWDFLAEEDDMPRKLLLDVIQRLQDLEEAPKAWTEAEWIEDMNKTSCERFHSHETVDDDEENAADAGKNNSFITLACLTHHRWCGILLRDSRRG